MFAVLVVCLVPGSGPGNELDVSNGGSADGGGYDEVAYNGDEDDGSAYVDGAYVGGTDDCGTYADGPSEYVARADDDAVFNSTRNDRFIVGGCDRATIVSTSPLVV